MIKILQPEKVRATNWPALTREHPCPNCHGKRVPCDMCRGARINPEIAILDREEDK